MGPRCRAGGVVLLLAVFEILRARGAGEDVIARIVFARARLVVEGSAVDQLLSCLRWAMTTVSPPRRIRVGRIREGSR